MNNGTHWGGPVRYIDTSRATPYIVVDLKEKQAIVKEVQGRVSEKDLMIIFSFLSDREIVDIKFK